MTSLSFLAAGEGWQPSRLLCSPGGLSRRTASGVRITAAVFQGSNPSGAPHVSQLVHVYCVPYWAGHMASTPASVGRATSEGASWGWWGSARMGRQPCTLAEACVSLHYWGPVATSSGLLPDSCAMATSHLPRDCADTESLGYRGKEECITY